MEVWGETLNPEYLSSLNEEEVGEQTRAPVPSKLQHEAWLVLGTQKGKSINLDIKLEFKK